MVPFYTYWKQQKTSGFMKFSGGLEWNIGVKWVN